MKDGDFNYFQWTMESLRVLGSWCADCAEMALPVLEKTG
jgi:hypothetical protein